MTPDREDIAAVVRGRMLQDVDPVRVAQSMAHKLAFMREVEALPEPRRCKGGPVNHDGSCFVCGDDQGELARCVRAHLQETQGHE